MKSFSSCLFSSSPVRFLESSFRRSSDQARSQETRSESPSPTSFTASSKPPLRPIQTHQISCQKHAHRTLNSPMPNRGPLILSIDEAEYLCVHSTSFLPSCYSNLTPLFAISLDQLPPPEEEGYNDPNDIATKVRKRLLEFLNELRKGAEGSFLHLFRGSTVVLGSPLRLTMKGETGNAVESGPK